MWSDYIRFALQVIVGLGILNVWFLRGGRPTPYRGGNKQNLREEFAHYGLPPAAMYAVGFLKVACAIGLLLGLFLPGLVNPSAAILVILMIGAISMHLKVKDPAQRSLPAAIMLLFSVLILLL